MEAKNIWFDTVYIYLETTENMIGKMPLVWFPRLLNASEEDRNKFELWADNSWIHWEEIGEDLSVEGFFTFKKDNMGVQF
jgi:hypothetical protein